MAHSKQAKKRIRTSERKRLQNKGVASRMRTHVKRVLAAVEGGDLDAARQALPGAIKRIDKAAQSRVLHKNAAANRKSMLARAIARVAAAN